eukprot:TRINITY_DN17459_c0_g1_i1.p1 TRINITY_DN17459_c0_g1~~TRINITY_DN17459_c0_g1_i1.p1  ORF type:complete len:131 (-),score=20.55 TRINITY_DN17459_c0_g1_i1:97-489(-)
MRPAWQPIGYVYHKKCLKCEHCKKSLTPSNLNTHQEKKIYCQICYNSIFKLEMDDVLGQEKMQVLPIGGILQILAPKPVVVDGPTAEEIKHKEIAEAARKAWEEVVALGEVVPSSGMKIKEALTLVGDVN